MNAAPKSAQLEMLGDDVRNKQAERIKLRTHVADRAI
jgi:hypothetical protein